MLDQDHADSGLETPEISLLARYQLFSHLTVHFNTGWSSTYGILVDIKDSKKDNRQELTFTGVKSSFSPDITHDWIIDNLLRAPEDQDNIMHGPLHLFLSEKQLEINRLYNSLLYKILNLHLDSSEVDESKRIVACSPLPRWRHFLENYENIHLVYNSSMTEATISLVHRQPALIRYEYFKLMDGLVKKLISYKKTKYTNVFLPPPTLKDRAVCALVQAGNWNDFKYGFEEDKKSDAGLLPKDVHMRSIQNYMETNVKNAEKKRKAEKEERKKDETQSKKPKRDDNSW